MRKEIFYWRRYLTGLNIFFFFFFSYEVKAESIKVPQSLSNAELDQGDAKQPNPLSDGSFEKPASKSTPVENTKQENSSEVSSKEDSQTLQEIPLEEEMIPDVVPPTLTSVPIGQVNEFGGAPTFPGGRRNMAFGEAPDEYQVQPGDTLFDICDQLIDDADYWPKLWSLNPYIRNPHFIYPGMRLKFFPGDEETPPSLKIVQEEDILPVETGKVLAKEVVKPTRNIQALLVDSMEVEQQPIVQNQDVIVPSSISADFEYYGPEVNHTGTEIVLPFIISAEEKESLAEVLGGEEGQLLVGDQNELVVRAEKLDLNVTYSVLRFSGKIYSPYDDRFVGYRYEFISHAKTLGNSNPSDLSLVRMQPLAIRIPPTKGDVVVPFISTKRFLKFGEAGRDASLVQSSIAGTQDPTKYMASEGDFILLDKSYNANDIVKIYTDLRKDKNRSSGVEDFETLREAAKVRVIENYSKFGADASVGYVISNKLDMKVGDKTSKNM